MFWQANFYKKVDNRTEIISQIDETVAIETGTQTYTEQVYLFCSMETVLSYSLSNHNIPDIHTKAHPMVTLKYTNQQLPSITGLKSYLKE